MDWNLGFFRIFGSQWLNLLQFDMFLVYMHFLHAFLILAATPPARGGAGRLRKSSGCVLEYFFEISLLFFFIHQCEKGKPPTGVNYQDFFSRTQLAGSKQQDLWIFDSILAGLFFSKHLLCKRGGWWDKFWYTSVRRGSLPLVYVTEFFWGTKETESKHEDLWILDSIFAGWGLKKKRLLCKRGGWWDKFWYTSVRRGSLPLVYATERFFWGTQGDWNQTWRSVSFWWDFCRVIFEKHNTCSAREGVWWDKFWYTSVRRGSLPLVYAREIFFEEPRETEINHEDLWFFDLIFAGWCLKKQPFLCKRGVDGTSFDTPVWEGEASRWCFHYACLLSLRTTHMHTHMYIYIYIYIYIVEEGASHTNHGYRQRFVCS